MCDTPMGPSESPTFRKTFGMRSSWTSLTFCVALINLVSTTSTSSQCASLFSRKSQSSLVIFLSRFWLSLASHFLLRLSLTGLLLVVPNFVSLHHFRRLEIYANMRAIWIYGVLQLCSKEVLRWKYVTMMTLSLSMLLGPDCSSGCIADYRYICLQLCQSLGWYIVCSLLRWSWIGVCPFRLDSTLLQVLHSGRMPFFSPG